MGLSICFSAVMSCTAADGVTHARAAALFTPVNGTVATALNMPGSRLRSSLVAATGTAARHSVVGPCQCSCFTIFR